MSYHSAQFYQELDSKPTGEGFSDPSKTSLPPLSDASHKATGGSDQPFKWEGPWTPSSASISFRFISSRGRQAQENSQTEEMLRAKYVGKGTPVPHPGALPNTAM